MDNSLDPLILVFKNKNEYKGTGIVIDFCLFL